MSSFYTGRKLSYLVFLNLIVIGSISSIWAITFDEVSSLHVWITVSSLVNKDPNNAKSLLFRQIELNWINAPLDDDNDYIGLYLDSQPDENTLPVSVHRLDGQPSGQIITDYYLPQIDFYNDTRQRQAMAGAGSPTAARQPRPSDLDMGVLSGNTYRPLPAATRYASADHEASAVRHSLVDECIGYCLAYHTRNKILARNCLKTSPNWMRDSFQLIGPRSLPSLMIPGTHNSGTYPKQLDKTALHMINKYQLNQDESIFNQLLYGIRHLDLRVGYSKVKQHPEQLWIYHDIFRTEISVQEVFDQVRRFLDLTSHEIVVMDFHRFTVGFENESLAVQKERHSKLIELIFKQLGQYIVPSYLGQHAPLNEYVAMGKRLIIGYANKATILGPQAEHQPAFVFGGLLSDQSSGGGGKQPVRDVDAIKQDQEDWLVDLENSGGAGVSGRAPPQPAGEQVDRRVGSRLFNKLKSLKLISSSFSKRSMLAEPPKRNRSLKFISSSEQDAAAAYENTNNADDPPSFTKAALFFSPVRHLWPNKDTLEGLAQYMNDTTCRRYFGELRSMMAELTPTVFGAIADKYDGNRKLAQLVNRQVTDWIRDRWLHCVNIVASDYFLGNDLIRLAIHANKMRSQHRSRGSGEFGNSFDNCRSFRRVEHLLDKSKIPIQFAYQEPVLSSASSPTGTGDGISFTSPTTTGRGQHRMKDNDIIMHTSSDGNRILLRPLSTGYNAQSASREKRDSFVGNVSDGFSNLISSFKRLLNL